MIQERQRSRRRARTHGAPDSRGTIPGWAVLWLGLFLALVAVGLQAAQVRGVRFNRIELEDGLPGGEVRSIIQDRDGFIWLAAGNGLSRFDGYEFVSYGHVPGDTTSLSDNFVNSVVETRDGVLWVGSLGGGLSRFDPMTRRFTNFRHDPSTPGGLPDDQVRVVVEGPSGDLWIGTDGGGVAVFDRETTEVEVYRREIGNPDSLSADAVRDLIWDREGRLWVATQGGGVSRFDPATERFERFLHDPEDPTSLGSDLVRRLYEDREGVIWVGTSDAGLFRYDAETSGFLRVDLAPPEETVLATESVSAILEDSAGTFWVGTNAGLFERLRGQARFNRHRSDPADAKSIPSSSVRSLYEDRGGVLWVGTRGGIGTWNIHSGSFVHHFRSRDEPGELSDNWINGFAEDPSGAVWIGTLEGLNRFDPRAQTFRHFKTRDGNGLSDDRVMSVTVDSQGVLWVGTMRGGLNRFDAAAETFSVYAHDPEDPTSVGADGITSLYEDSRGNLWIGTFGGGLNRFDREREIFERFSHDPDDPQSLSGDRVMSIHEDPQGDLWVGTAESGINRMDRARRTFTRYLHDPTDSSSLSGDTAWWVTSDRHGNLWVATRTAGINRWSAEDRRQGRVRFRRFGEREGLNTQWVNAILEAKDGQLWVSTDTTLTRFDPESELFWNYDAAHGLQEEFNQAAAARMRNGDLYFGGVKGFNIVPVSGVGVNRHAPRVVLTDFLKFNEPFALETPPARVEEVSISHKDLVIAFEFAALDFTAVDKNRFQYKLEGFDQKWVNARHEHRATYTNLDAGHYRFLVRGSNNDGVWSEEPLSVGLIVMPPPWRSWWAHSIYALILGVIAFLIWRAIERRRRRARELRRMNASLQREIEARKQKEIALQAEKRKAREYFDVAEVLMVAIDGAGRVQLINQKGCRILGWSEEEIVGQPWLERFVPAERRDEVRAILDEITNHPYCEYPVVTRDGEERVIAWHSTQLPSPSGDWVTLSSGTDNTEIQALEKQVRMQQKMDALGTLAGGVAHDFNNILTAILGYSTLTLSQLPAESEEAGYLKHVVKGCERASDMVARILTFSRREDTAKKPIEIGPVVEEACDLLRSSLPATIEIRTSIAQDLEPVAADPTQIHQVLMNLGTNSGHAMPHGGVLEIDAEMVEVAPGSQTFDGELRRGRYVRISVKDSGEGMDQATMQRIFEPFFTTKEVGTGTGLGLSVAHGIVKGHQGDISVRSSPGKGTTMVVRLPCSKRPVVSDEQPGVAMGGDERVLLVDDEKPIVLLAKRWLEDQGYTVEPHTSSVEALAAFRAHPRRYDVLVADHNMPELDGAELVKQVKALRPGFAVVTTSGRDLRHLSEELGSVWLQKPFKSNDLAASVRMALADRRGLRSVS